MVDSSATPEYSEFKLYRYEPSMVAAVIFILLFLAVTVLHTYQLIRTRARSLILFIMGGHMQWLGYIGRALSAKEAPDYTLGPYIMQTLLLLIAPALFAASIYMVLGRIIRLVDGEIHSIIPLRWLTKLFVLGDVISFVAQGGGIMSSGTTPWQVHQYALYAGSALILVGSKFRIIDYSQGNAGYLISHEIYLYIFDSFPMFLAMAVFTWIHPSEVTAMLRRRGAKAVRKVIHFYQVY